jgi:small-conductance mechanosensitive channel
MAAKIGKGACMNFDLSHYPQIVQNSADYAIQGYELALRWLLSPAAWAQFAVLVVAYLLAVLVSRRLRPALQRVIDPGETQNMFTAARLFVLQFLPLILPLLAYAMTAIGEEVVRSIFDTAAVIAFGKRLFLFLAVRAFVRDIETEPFLRLLGRFILIPIAALYTLGILDPVTVALSETVVGVGNSQFSLISIVRGVIAGSLLFWLGQWSNNKPSAHIEKQQIRPSIRQLLIKTVEFAIFGIAFLVLMNIMGINLAALAVLGGAIGVGLGFGLQKIASNVISGVILLVEGRATAGDYVELDGGESGKIVKMTARAAILETFDVSWCPTRISS